MNIEQLRSYLERHQVPEDLYVIQELGEGEVDGIGFLDGGWCTYYSQRGEYSHIERFDTEEAAVASFLDRMRLLMRSEHGVVLP